MNTLLEWDYALFNFINHACANDFLDAIVPYWRERTFWYPFYVAILLFIILNFSWKKSLIMIVFMVVTVGTVDYTGNQIFKKNFERARPCQTEMHVEARTLVKCGSGYSFISNHASVHMAIALFFIGILGFISRYFNYFLVFWAISIGVGQVYVGVHYPSDVLAGFLYGGSVGYLFAWICRRLMNAEY